MILAFLADCLRLIGGALSLDGRVLLSAATDPQAYLAAVLLAVAAGTSLTLGQSVVLFANRVPPDRFAPTILGAVVLYLARMLLWTASIWLLGLVSPRYALPLDTTFLAVCFGQAPQLFAFFELLPYAGSSVRRALDAYSLVVVVAGLRAMLDVPVPAALLIAGLGWLLQAFLGGLLERPLAGVRAWMWHTASGQEEFDAEPWKDLRLPDDPPADPAPPAGPQSMAQRGTERAR